MRAQWIFLCLCDQTRPSVTYKWVSLYVCVFEMNPLLLVLSYLEEGHTRRIRHRDSDVVDSRKYIFLAPSGAQGVTILVCLVVCPAKVCLRAHNLHLSDF